MAGPATEFTEGWRLSPSLLALREVVEHGRRVRQALARRAGLTDTDLVAMEHLMREPLGPAELARILQVSTAAATGLVDRLVRHGHVQRQPHVADRRRTVVEITPSGREEMLGHLLPMFQALARLDASFSAEERAVVERYLRGVVAAYDEVAAQPPPSEA